MADIDFMFIGWQKDKKTNTDKVWTAFKAGNAYYAGWGRRDKTLRFKKHDSFSSLNKVMRSKQKTYSEVDSFQLFTIFPYFKDDVEKKLSFDILANNVM